jgi:hypothetical protein
MCDVKKQVIRKHPRLFEGRPRPVWNVWHGWLMLLDYTLEQMWWRMDECDRAGTYTQALNGELVILCDYPQHCGELLDALRDASGALCLCCGGYAMTLGPLPLCHSCN